MYKDVSECTLNIHFCHQSPFSQCLDISCNFMTMVYFNTQRDFGMPSFILLSSGAEKSTISLYIPLTWLTFLGNNSKVTHLQRVGDFQCNFKCSILFGLFCPYCCFCSDILTSTSSRYLSSLPYLRQNQTYTIDITYIMLVDSICDHSYCWYPNTLPHLFSG